MSESPSSNGPSNGDGRDSRGRFAPGCAPGPGNPNAATAAKHRTAFWRAIRDDDAEKALAVIRRVMDDPKARTSDQVIAAKEMLDRIVGRAVTSDLLERVEALEQLLSERENPRSN